MGDGSLRTEEASRRKRMKSPLACLLSSVLSPPTPLSIPSLHDPKRLHEGKKQSQMVVT